MINRQRLHRRKAGTSPSAGLQIGRRAAIGMLLAAPARAEEVDPWPALAAQIFPGQALMPGADVLTIEAPARAEDAAIVPVTLQSTLPAGDSRWIRKITLVVEANPSPLAAAFVFGEDAGVTRIGTRVRVDDYTNVRAVAEMSDGQLYQTARFVKAAGGCSAPSLKLSDDSNPIGTLRFRVFPASAAGGREAQVMVRHPNYSGMQMDQVSRLYIPANFVQELRVWQGERLLLTVQSGISVSENPAFRFSFKPSDAHAYRVEVTDSSGRHFAQEFIPQGAAL